MNWKYWRGRLLLRLVKILDPWLTKATAQAKRDLGASAGLPLFDRLDKEGK